jgi:uncharacterized peroxidase-related enzyme
MDSGWRKAGLDPAEFAMLDYAEKLALHPDRMQKTDIDKLREVGWSDADILRICQVVSYFSYVNRMADGLGVELEEWFSEE